MALSSAIFIAVLFSLRVAALPSGSQTSSVTLALLELMAHLCNRGPPSPVPDHYSQFVAVRYYTNSTLASSTARISLWSSQPSLDSLAPPSRSNTLTGLTSPKLSNCPTLTASDDGSKPVYTQTVTVLSGLTVLRGETADQR